MAAITGILHAIDAIDAIDAIRRNDGTIVPSRGAWAPQQHVDQARKDGTRITMKGLAWLLRPVSPPTSSTHTPTYATRWRLCLGREGAGREWRPAVSRTPMQPPARWSDD
ncbi:hypothetical protein [Streptomyces sp. NPDC001340]